MSDNVPNSDNRPVGMKSTAFAYLQLVRLPNVFSAMADVVMGFLLVRALTTPTGLPLIAGVADIALLGLLVTTSGLLYMAGMVLNDLVDYRIDSQQRPERPLPSGRIVPTAARRLGWGLLTCGIVAGVAAGGMTCQWRPVWVACVLAVCVVLYDTVLKPTPLGPLAMGGCRMLNVALGMSAVAMPWHAVHWLVVGGIGTYVVGVTWFARTEARRSDRLSLACGVGVMLGGVAMLATFPLGLEEPLPPAMLYNWRLLMAVLGALIGWRCLWAVIDPMPSRVQMAVKQCLLSLVVLDAAVCFLAAGMVAAVAVLLLLVPMVLLGRWFYAT